MTDHPAEADISQLDLDTLDALRGATELRKRLLLEMSTGSPAITDLAYAIKVRIKEDYKIIDKVKKKQLKNSNYGVKDLRDILGLRIVTLYRLDALKIIPVLLDKIRSTNTDLHGLFVPLSLEEVIIYSTNPVGDPQSFASRVLEIFSARGLKTIAKIDGTPSNYTSIHMVTWCRGKYRDGYRKIPVEIQVRTALEDVWSEIDHSLKYKRELTDQKVSVDSLDDSRLLSSLSHLNVMKTLVDGVAQYADQIKIQLDEVDDHRVRSTHSRQAEDSLVLLESIKELPEDLREVIASAVRHSNDVIGPQGNGLTKSERRGALRRALADFDSLRVDVQLAGVLDSDAEKMINYIVEAERALLLFEIGNATESGTSLLAEASKIYTKLQNANSDKAVLLYRHAKVLDAMGDRETAVALLQKAIPRLDSDGNLAGGLWVRFAARRVLGVLLWEGGDSLRRNALASAAAASPKDRVISAFKEAYRVTREAYDESNISSEELKAGNAQSERQKIANNLLWFALEYIEEGGNPMDLEKGFDTSVVDSFLNQMQDGNLANQEDQRVLDTARRAYEYTMSWKKSCDAAQRIIDNYGNGTAERADQQDEDMLRAAHATLERHSTAKE